MMKGEIDMDKEKVEKVETEESNEELNEQIMNGLDQLGDITIEAIKSKRREWFKGFAAGYGSALTGLAIGGLIVKLTNRDNK
jgi:hypothetical protein